MDIHAHVDIKMRAAMDAHHQKMKAKGMMEKPSPHGERYMPMSPKEVFGPPEKRKNPFGR